MISSDAALGLAVLFLFLGMMLWGVFETFWPSKPKINRPSGGHRVRKRLARQPMPEPMRLDARPRYFNFDVIEVPCDGVM